MIIDVDFLWFLALQLCKGYQHTLSPIAAQLRKLPPPSANGGCQTSLGENEESLQIHIFVHCTLRGCIIPPVKTMQFLSDIFSGNHPEKVKHQMMTWLVTHNIHPHKALPKDQLKQFCLIFSTYPFCEITCFFFWNQVDVLIALNLAIADFKTESNFNLGDDGASCHNLLIIAIVLSNWCTNTWFDLLRNLNMTNKPAYKVPGVFESGCLHVVANTHAIHECKNRDSFASRV